MHLSKNDVAGMLLLLFCAFSGAFAREDCTPPAFYTNLPRDREFYYGVARDTDTDAARDKAIRNLGKQVSGEVEEWEQKKVDDIAGPGQDRWQVAAAVGRLLPHSTLLSGWEQDDFGRCNGYSYVLVRIEKERVEKFVRGSDQFKKDVIANLAQRVEKLEKDVNTLSTRLDRLERGLACIKKSSATVSGADDFAARVADARTAFKAGISGDKLEQKLVLAEDSYSKLAERMRTYQSKNDKAESARLAALKKANASDLSRLLDKLKYDEWEFIDASRIQMIYRDEQEYDAIRTFSHGIMDGPNRKNLGQYEPNFYYQIIAADIMLKDDDATLKDGEYFLKNYPDSSLFQAVKSQMNGIIMMARIKKQQATAQPVPAQPAFDPCQDAQN
jgi:hypothetical protein